MLWALYNTVTGAGPRIACFRGTPFALNRFLLHVPEPPHPNNPAPTHKCINVYTVITKVVHLRGATASAQAMSMQRCVNFKCVQSFFVSSRLNSIGLRRY